MAFQLAVSAEMSWPDRPMAKPAAGLTEPKFGVGLWDWRDHDLHALDRSGATFIIMNGYLDGRLADDGNPKVRTQVVTGQMWLKTRDTLHPTADTHRRFEPGNGEMTHAVIARAPADMGYDGPVGMEAFAKDDPEAAPDAFRKAHTL